jgi:hypothetical protein
VDISLGEQFLDYQKFMILLGHLQNVKIIKILSITHRPSECKIVESIKYENLERLEMINHGQDVELKKILSDTVEFPALQNLIFKCRYLKAKDFELILEFAVKWSNFNLKCIHIGGFEMDRNRWSEFLWNKDTLHLSELSDAAEIKIISNFVECHATEFSKIKQLVINGCTLPENTEILIFSNTTKIESLSTDLKLSTLNTNVTTYKSLKILKLKSLTLVSTEFETVRLLKKLFPNIETLLIYEEISETLAKLIKTSFTDLKIFKHNMRFNRFMDEFPRNQHLYQFDMCGWIHDF